MDISELISEGRDLVEVIRRDPRRYAKSIQLSQDAIVESLAFLRALGRGDFDAAEAHLAEFERQNEEHLKRMDGPAALTEVLHIIDTLDSVATAAANVHAL